MSCALGQGVHLPDTDPPGGPEYMSLGACEEEESDLNLGDSRRPSLGTQAAFVSNLPSHL